MKDWKKYSTNRLRLILTIAVLTLPLCPAAIAQSETDTEVAKTMHLQAYSMIGKADEFRNERNWEKALPLYKAAQKIYREMRNRFPDWKSEVIRQRLADCNQQIAFIENIQNETLRAPDRSKSSGGDPANTDGKSTKESEAESELEMLRQENRDLREQFDRVTQRASELKTGTEDRLRRKMEPIIKENEKLRLKVKRLEEGQEGEGKSKAELRKRIGELTEENVDLNEQLSKALGDIRSTKLEKKCEQLQGENKRLRKQMAKGVGGDEVVEDLKKLWRTKFEEFQESVDEREADLKEQIQKLREENYEKEERIEKLAQENRKLGQRLESLSDSETKLERKQSKIEELEARIEELKEKSDKDLKLQKQAAAAMEEELRKEMSRKKQEWKEEREQLVAEWESKLEEANQDKKELRDEMDAREAEWEKEHAELIEKWEKKLAKTEKDYESRLSELESEWRKRIDETENQSENRLSNAREEISGLESKLAEAWEKAKQEKKKIASQLESELEKLRDRNDALAEKLAELPDSEEIVGSLRRKIEELKSSLDSMKERSKAEVEAERAKLKEKSELWRAKFKEISTKLQEKMNQLAAKGQEIEKLKERYAESEIGDVLKEMEKEREEHLEAMRLMRDSLRKLKRERDLLSDQKFKLEGKLLEMQRRYGEGGE